MSMLTDEVALITGASRGIGKSIARLFAAEGAAVAVHGRDRTAVDKLVAEIVDAGGRATGVIGELTEPSEVARVVEQAEAELGGLTVLIANAGGNPVPPGPVETTSHNQWRSAIDVNLTLTFLTIAAVLPRMRQRGRGSIVTISSAASRRPTAQTPVAYAAAKAGIEVLTRIVATQAGPDGIRANCIAPETILTEANEQRIPADIRQRLVESHPIRRLGTPEDIAHAALYLASDTASWVNGVTLDVAGGTVLR
jgi:3-oxoacyl-[acyl-carrier protein] reductase